MPDRRTGYYVAGRDWPPIASGIPLGELYRALDGITDEAVDAAMGSLANVRVPEPGQDPAPRAAETETTDA